MRAKLGFKHAECVAAGDSGNDVTMLDADMPFILVGNSSEELLQGARARPRAYHYHAGKSHADGCIEGLLHFRASTGQARRGERGAVLV